MQRFLIVNPRSGTGSPSADELRGRRPPARASTSTCSRRARTGGGRAARRRRRARDGGRRRLARGGGRGRIEQDCRSSASRSGRATTSPATSGSTDDPLAALAAFDGEERQVDVGRVGDRLFLNNVSLGLYALLVHRREHHRRRRDALARLRALALTLATAAGASASRSTASRCARGRARREQRLQPRPVLARRARAARRGLLHLYVPHGFRRVTWEEQSCTELEIGSPLPRLRAAVDGEPAELDTPLGSGSSRRATRARAARARG